MNHLIQPAELASLLDRQPLILDCRFDLADTDRGARDYVSAHIPGALYAHLDHALSGPLGESLGRHPLPDAAAFAVTLSNWGWDGRVPVIAYDDGSGAIAARAWWLMQMAGHHEVAVLDGGWAAWQTAGLATSSQVESKQTTKVELTFDSRRVMYATQLQDALARKDVLLLDARAAERYRGEVEPIDSRAGHVPGAQNRPYAANLLPDGHFKPDAVLREEFVRLLDGRNAEQVVHMCGSGVTACHNLLAMEHAGLPGSRLFAPSWSGWISDPSLPIEP